MENSKVWQGPMHFPSVEETRFGNWFLGTEHGGRMFSAGRSMTCSGFFPADAGPFAPDRLMLAAVSGHSAPNLQALLARADSRARRDPGLPVRAGDAG